VLQEGLLPAGPSYEFVPPGGEARWLEEMTGQGENAAATLAKRISVDPRAPLRESAQHPAGRRHESLVRIIANSCHDAAATKAELTITALSRKKGTANSQVSDERHRKFVLQLKQRSSERILPAACSSSGSSGRPLAERSFEAQCSLD